MKLTCEQQAAVVTEETSVAVVAGAGTGKTRVLIARYLHLLERGVEASRILAVTFTEKAAREMKDRIRRAVSGERAPQVEFAPISTMHAFLARLLRERALDAGVDPRFLMADALTSDLLLDDALEETVAELDADTLDALVDLTGPEDFLRRLYLAARATPHPLADLFWREPAPGNLKQRVEAFLDECAAQQGSTGKTLARLARIQACAPRLRDLQSEAVVEFCAAVKGGVAAGQRDLFRRGKGLAEECAVHRLLPRAREVGAAVVRALVALDARYAQKKRADSLLDFSDLEHFGLSLLRRVDLSLEFDHVLVDEYQDTSRIQEAILEQLARGCARFGVGDAKQSIYRFRYADAQIFRELQERARTYPLAGCFRSRPELVAFHNRLFARLFEQGGVRGQELHAAASWRDKELKSVDLLVAEAARAGAARRREAQLLARHLCSLVGSARLSITRSDREERPLVYGDCAILLRAMSNLPLYERALNEADVPYVVVMGRGYYAAREIVELAFLLSLLGDPCDRYRAVAVLTSLLCGVPEADLLHLPREGALVTAALSMQRPDPIPPERWERLIRFGRRFEHWRDRAARVECGDLIETILTETRFADLLLLERDGRRRHANLMKALRRARQEQADPAGYARELLEFRERELRESEAPIAAETENAVKIMTVHAAKGLEFPLVAVADLAWRRQARTATMLRADGGFGLRMRDGETPGLDELKAWEGRQEKNEQKRLLYVAFTRAQEHLVLSAALYKAADDGLVRPWLDAPPPEMEIVPAAPLLVADRRRRRQAGLRAALRRKADLPRAMERDRQAARDLLERIDAIRLPERDATPYVTAVADLVEFRRCPRRYRLGRMLGIEIEERDPPDRSERPYAEEHPRRALGSVFHALMADVEVGPGAVPDADKLREHFPEATAGDAARIIQWSSWLADQEICARLQEQTQQREMSFVARVGGLAVRGVIDLYVPSLPLLLDYKTGARVRPDEYAVQVAVYLAALRALGWPVPEVGHLVYVDAQAIVEVPEQSLEALLDAFAEAHKGSAGFPPAPGEACTHCDFRKACVANGVPCPGSLELF